MAGIPALVLHGGKGLSCDGRLGITDEMSHELDVVGGGPTIALDGAVRLLSDIQVS